LIIASAPGRCGIVGNPSDMYGGSVISCSTTERAYCELTTDVLVTTIEVSGVTQELTQISDLKLHDGDYLNVVRAVLSALEVDPATCKPFGLKAYTEIPMKAGLAGSTAILTAVVGAVLAYLEIGVQRHGIAELVRKIEREFLGIVCGYQDQYMSTFGGLNYMDFRDKSPSVMTEDEMVFATVENLNHYVGAPPLVLAHTGVQHHSGTVQTPLLERWLAGDTEVVDGNLEIAKLARAGKRALLSQDWELLGALMNQNHAIQKSLGGSAESNDRMIKAALDAGALGSKLAGAGGGGTIIAITTDPEAMGAALLAAGAEAIYTPRPLSGLTVEVRM